MTGTAAALTAYAVAVRATAYAVEHGRHGDGRPEAARAAEAAARRAVLAAVRAEIREASAPPAPELAVSCPWCGAEPGDTCTTRAAHPVTGRAMLAPVPVHAERAAELAEARA